ncbi:FAD-binding oxidoreductase [Proteocatella sphenisci]|uniref:FAD-binding oxidoreductase n=1 Tax=Proteocatella sphenisci TaxID=181070 RepID=UPI00048A8313|nr:FAD-binding oxidoreductase [Proteocatella sphenisci]
MEQQVLIIRKIEKITHNVLRFTLNNTNKIKFMPGQAAELAVDKDGWRDKRNPFTFTSLPFEDHLEFTIKIYPDHNGVTNELSKLEVGDKIILKSVFGAIQFEGKGTFIAGGAGVTPFISIIRDLHQKGNLKGNRLIFANSTQIDIINKNEFESILGDNFLNILSREEVDPYSHGRIDTAYLKDNITSPEDYFYICGPEPMMDTVEDSLKELGVEEDKIVKEVFN